MSGHSKWSKIQHKKGKIDKARSSVFTKLLRAITVCAQQGGGDLDMNFSLRLAVQKAKAANVPKDNIERAIKKGTGELSEGVRFEEVLYEGFGPQGIGFVVETMTDNTNRTVSEVKHVFTKHGGSLGGPGSVTWQFLQKGVLRFSLEERKKISDWDSFQLTLMDAGVEDIKEYEEGIELQCAKEDLQNAVAACEQAGIELEDSGLEWIANESISVDDELKEKIENIYEALDELDDVKSIYTNHE